MHENDRRLLIHLAGPASVASKKARDESAFWADPRYQFHAVAPLHLRSHSWEHAYPGHEFSHHHSEYHPIHLQHSSKMDSDPHYIHVKRIADKMNYWNQFHPDIKRRATLLAYAHFTGKDHSHTNSVQSALAHPRFAELVSLSKSTPVKKYDWEHTLGVHRHDGHGAAASSYRKSSLIHHPNKGGRTENFHRLQAAYNASKVYHQKMGFIK
jgi:hypothetical protein